MSKPAPIRCPTTSRMFGMKVDDELEFKCDNCTKNARRQDPFVTGVYHYYSADGTYCRTITEH